MPMITWNASLSVGVAEIDAQHQKLIAIINELGEAMKAGQGKARLEDLFTHLIRYTEEHFSFEEKRFAEFGYAESASHIAEHRDLVQQVANLKKDFDAGVAGVAIHVMDFLSDWLTKHILGTDRKYTSCFHEHGMK